MFPRASTLELQQADRARWERQERIARARDAYFTRFPPTLAKTDGDPKAQDNVRLSLSALIVNKGVSFLFGFQLDFEVDGKRESPEEQWLAECLDKNRRMTLLHKLGINGGIAGHCFVRVLPANEAVSGHPYPRLVVWDPAMVEVEWEPDDCEQVRSFTYEWKAVETVNNRRVAVARRQVIARDGARWTITDEESVGDSPVWVETGQDIWPYPWAPVFHCQNLPCPNEFWGIADLEEATVDLNITVNRIESNINRIIRIYAHPFTYATGLSSTATIDTTPGKINNLGKDGALKNLEMQSDLTSSLEFGRETRSAFFTTTRIPEVASGRVEDLGSLSGRALQILYGPVIELTGTKRLTYGEMLSDLCSRLLELGGHGPGRKVVPQWPPVVPGDPKEDAETAVTKQAAGVSVDTTLSEMGYDPRAEARKRKQEQRDDRALGSRLLDRESRGGDETDDEEEDDDE